MEMIDSNKLFENVLKATRLLYEFQKRMQDTMFHIKSRLKLSPAGRIEVNKLYSRAPRQSKDYGETQLQDGNWAWDYIYPQAMEYYLGKKKIGNYDLALSAIQLADDGFYVATQNYENANRLRTETYADVSFSTSWIIFVMEIKSFSLEWAKRWERDSMESNLNIWMSNKEAIIKDITHSGSNFIVMKFPLQQIISENAIDSTLNIVSDMVLDVIGESIL